MIIYSKYGVINYWSSDIFIKLLDNDEEFTEYMGHECKNITIEYENDCIIIHCYEYNNHNKEIIKYICNKYEILQFYQNMYN